VQAKAVDTWNYYQAESMKQNLAEATLDELQAVSTAAGDTPAGRRLEDYRGKISRYEREKEDVKSQAESFEHQYEALNVRHDQFDLSYAAMSVAIALLGVTARTRKRWLLGVAAEFLAVGVLFGVVVSRLEPSRGCVDILAGIEQVESATFSRQSPRCFAILVGGLNEESPVPHGVPGPDPRHGRTSAERQRDGS
jgi:hypothetical protein